MARNDEVSRLNRAVAISLSGVATLLFLASVCTSSDWRDLFRNLFSESLGIVVTYLLLQNVIQKRVTQSEILPKRHFLLSELRYFIEYIGGWWWHQLNDASKPCSRRAPEFWSTESRFIIVEGLIQDPSRLEWSAGCFVDFDKRLDRLMLLNPELLDPDILHSLRDISNALRHFIELARSARALRPEFRQIKELWISDGFLTRMKELDDAIIRYEKELMTDGQEATAL